MSAPSTTTTTASATAKDASNTLTTVPMTAIFTPPPACAKSWTYEPEVYNNVEPSGLLMQNCETVVSSCFPSGFADSGRRTATLIYSPGYCPMGYTSADLAINGPTTTAVCCLSNFSYTTSTMIYSNLPSAIYAGCTSTFDTSSSTVVAARASQSDQGTMIFGPMVMWAQPITVLIQSSDSRLFVTSTSATSSSTVSSTESTTPVSSTPSLTPTTQPSQNPQPTSSPTGLSSGAKAGVGIGAAIGALAVLGLIAWWLYSRRTKRNSGAVVPPNNQHEYYSDPVAKNGSPVELAPRDAKYGNTAEMQTIPISELQA